MSQSFFSAELIPAWIRIPVGFGLIGLAYAQDAPGTHVVTSPLGDLALGNLTLPVAMVVFGSQLGRTLTALAKWRPHVIVEHRHVHSPADDTPT